MTKKDLLLWYSKPAEEWVESLPIGNGRLGGMIYGGIKNERISLNEDTLWSGMPREEDQSEAVKYLDEVRHLISLGQYRDAQTIIENHMLGPWSHAYQAMGDLWIEFKSGSTVQDYKRTLDLRTALSTSEFTHNSIRYKRESFVSAVDQVMVIRLESDQKGKINFETMLTSPLNHQVKKVGRDHVMMEGVAPSYVEPIEKNNQDLVVYEEKKGIRFQTHLKVIPEGGHIETDGAVLAVKSADSVTLLLSSATSFNGFDKNPVTEGKDPFPICTKWLTDASRLTYQELRERHIEDYERFFNRVELELSDNGFEDLPTDERIMAVRGGGEDPYLAELFFQFGRYLLICSSRPHTQPATLQGIWNNMTRPPWACNYTTNINTEMNYWLAETCHLAEFHEPLFDMLEDLRLTGSKMVKTHYNCRGWSAHHAVDLWRTATPQGGPSKGPASWAFWPMAGPWLCQHLWEHYAFGKSKVFLKNKAYPLMKESALFCLDYLTEDENGYLVSSPSTSPENTFLSSNGEPAAVSMSSTMDIAIMRELFTHCIEASNLLDIDHELRSELESARDRLLPFQIGKEGQLQEWFKDFEEAEPGHRHTAHLYPLHPGNQITLRSTPELAKAVRVSLERRRLHEGKDTIGWVFAWYINFYARLEDPETAYEYLQKLLGNPHPNLFNAHRHPKLTFHPLTIEANFAATAGIVEMLLQSHEGELHLLPALPKAWKKGKISGIRARGGYELDIEWQNGDLSSALIKSAFDGVCKVRTKTPVTVDKAEMVNDCSDVIQFNVKAGESYQLKSIQKQIEQIN
ncbi:glycoside hydrolase family 95 protein [Pullulanibacillus sp. KACC 23026]|uniref:glycoside hydrolase family 95 protein n=1 Tax=Pullulanibacillus sp. KACC 23026 TaxID=3028315 RepID=UPI0023AF19C6|nr:glycoside hydrolase family 95 protein [Pullulanibacillus sp. KACC 23026]WEG11736.1 glycoside hydrolase family 95 protein [Pullulanibacillus sp. KACC 23026]